LLDTHRQEGSAPAAYLPSFQWGELPILSGDIAAAATTVLFVAEVLRESRLILDVFRDGFDTQVSLHGGIEIVTFPTPSWRLA
jgi:hypothetical protein